MKITLTVTNNNPQTLWNRLTRQLGRPPTNQECKAAIFAALAK
jgi:N-glycosylase/DNA lyase